MADGITCAATTTFQNDAHADASGDAIAGSYSFKDISVKCPANFPDLGALGQKVYRGAQNLQHGDGAGTSVTSLIDQNVGLIFDSGKTLSYSSTGQQNRVTRLGSLVQGASGKPSGKDGCQLILGGTTTFRGLVELYGCYLKTLVGGLNIVPGVTGLSSALINTLLLSASNIVIGTVAGEILRVYNLDCVSLAASSAGAITNFNVLDAQRVTVASNTANNFIRSGAGVRIKDLVMIGTLQGVLPSELRNTGTEDWDVVNPTYAGNQNLHSVSGGGNINEWFGFGVLTVNKLTGALLSGIPVQMFDRFGTLVLEGLTDADGQIDFGTVGDITENAVRVRYATNGVNTYQNFFPFTVVVNQGIYRVPGYGAYEYQLNWAKRSLGSFGDQFVPMLEVIYLEPNGPMTVFHECEAD